MIQINNLPEGHSTFVVARKVEGAYGKKSEYWYYGSYETEERAYEVAEEIGGQVFHRLKKITLSTIIDPTATMGMRTEIEEEE